MSGANGAPLPWGPGSFRGAHEPLPPVVQTLGWVPAGLAAGPLCGLRSGVETDPSLPSIRGLPLQEISDSRRNAPEVCPVSAAALPGPEGRTLLPDGSPSLLSLDRGPTAPQVLQVPCTPCCSQWNWVAGGSSPCGLTGGQISLPRAQYRHPAQLPSCGTKPPRNSTGELGGAQGCGGRGLHLVAGGFQVCVCWSFQE